MPAVAVIREPQALSEFTGRKAFVGALLGFLSNLWGSTLKPQKKPAELRMSEVNGTLGVGVESVDIEGNTKSEGI